MPSYPCPICGDPNAYPIWIDATPPRGCPDDEAWQEGRPPRITSVCERQLTRARQAADWRKRCPEAFDHEGNIKEGGLAMVMNKLDRLAAQKREELPHGREPRTKRDGRC